jgi:hypothetical protein
MTRFRRPGDLAVVEDVAHGTVYVATVPAGPLVVLGGPAAAVWRAAVGEDATGDDEADVVERVAEASGVPASEIRTEVEAFVADLLARGYLEPVE